MVLTFTGSLTHHANACNLIKAKPLTGIRKRRRNLFAGLSVTKAEISARVMGVPVTLLVSCKKRTSSVTQT
ncbi:hypothetical protein SADUNF_Sadunf09G0132800 [Salix dunnii]|uniref:Uncharacterized protein n=1 Tax=Salix dunnii TaxID=1413687 RepID=A0A835JS44_9ROSI|nr:hypothetical protein SADUNF_Sadunf09G0132800 [Salix dunnii]